MNETITTDEIDGVSIVKPAGKLTLSEGNALKQHVRALGKTMVIVDMSLLASIDSAGLGTVLQLKNQVEEAGGVLKLCAMTKFVLNVFTMTRLHHVFDIYNSVDEALLAFEK